MDIKREKKLHRFSSIAVGVLFFGTVVAVIWNLFLYLFNSDKLKTHGFLGEANVTLHFYKDNLITTAFIVLVVCMLLLMLALAILLGIHKNAIVQKNLPERRGFLQIIRILSGFALLAIPVIYSVFLMYEFDLGKFQGTSNMIAIILAVPASLYFLFPGITDRFSEFLQTVFGILFIGFCVFSLITTHAYMLEGLTSPVRAFNLLSPVCMMLFILYEIRFLATAKPLPNLYLATAGCTVFFCAVNGLPNLLLAAIGERDFSLQSVYAVLEIMLCLYAACRLMLFLREWKYNLRVAASAAEPLPEALPLQPQSPAEAPVEPDYTEDSEIESPILQAEIDVELFDRAFDGSAEQSADALDAIAAPGASAEAEAEEQDPLDTVAKPLTPTQSNETDEDPLEQLIKDIQSGELPTAQTAGEAKSDEDTFDALTRNMFGTSEEGKNE